MSLNSPNTEVHRAVLQFARWPVRGHVKTRLAESIGEDAALSAHLELSETVMANLSGWPGVQRELWLDQLPGPSSEYFADGKTLLECAEKFEYAVNTQVGADLGERMYHALHHKLLEADHVFIVGSDCPTVTDSVLDAADQALNVSDVVMVPSDDGGYVLIGARKTHQTMFDEVRWGSEHALMDTLKNLVQCNLTVTLLKAEFDVDTEEDYQRWRKQIDAADD